MLGDSTVLADCMNIMLAQSRDKIVWLLSKNDIMERRFLARHLRQVMCKSLMQHFERRATTC